MKRYALSILLLTTTLTVFAQNVEVFPQMGHSGEVNSVTFSPDGRQVLSGSGDKTVKLWDAITGREIRTFSGHSGEVNSVSFSPDGRQILSGSTDGTVKLWDVATGHEIRTFGDSSWVTSVAFSPNGRQVLSGIRGFERTVKLWDAATGHEIRKTFWGLDDVTSVSFNPDGRQVLASGDGIVKLWDVATSREIMTFSGYFGFFSPDGRQILSGTGDNTVKLWDAATGREIRTFSVVSSGVLAFSPDGRQVLASGDGIVKLWDVTTGREIRTFSGHSGGVRSLAFSPDGRQVLSGSSNRTLKLWDAATGHEIKTFSGFPNTVHAVSFSPDGQQVLSGYSEGMYPNRRGVVKLWDVVTGREIRTFSGHSEAVWSVSFSSDGRQVLSSSGDDTFKLWDTATGREIRTFSERSVYSAIFSPDGRQILSRNGGIVKLWDIATGREIRTFSGASGGSIAFSPDGRQVLSGGGGIVKLWNTATSREIWTFRGEYNTAISASFSPDGQHVLSGNDMTVKLFDTATGRELRTFSGHSNNVISASFSPDGRQVLSSSWDKTVKLWDTATGREIRTFSGHSYVVTSVKFSPDGRQVLSCGSDDTDTGIIFNDNTVKLWDTATGRDIRTLSGHSDWVNSVSFSPNGRQVLSHSPDCTIRIWETSTGKEIAQFISFTDGEWLVLTPDGYYNASPNGDQYLNVRVGNNVYGIDQYRSMFYKPAMVALALSGDTNAYLAAVKQGGVTVQDASIAPPAVTVTVPPSASAARTSITVAVDGGSRSIEYLTVKVNGKIVARDMGVTPAGTKALTPVANLKVLADGKLNKKQARFNLDIPLDPGDNVIEVLAFNGYSEGRAITTVSYSTSQRNLPNLYILSIGVSSYTDNSIPNLRFAANDARGIVTAFKAQEGKRYGSVKSLVIADGGDRDPTSDNIRNGMDFLQGAGQNDVMVLFLSGHGGTDDRGNFFFLPRNTAFNANGGPQRSSVIPNSDLQDVLQFQGQKLVFIDSCYSGGISGRQVGGVDNEVLINSLRENSPVIFTSSSKSERSWEHDPAKLGLFTHVLLEGLSGKADADRDGKITIEELGNYVRRTVPSMRDTQTPYYLAPAGLRSFVIAETGK